jgi:hypothetical protein
MATEEHRTTSDDAIMNDADQNTTITTVAVETTAVPSSGNAEAAVRSPAHESTDHILTAALAAPGTPIDVPISSVLPPASAIAAPPLAPPPMPVRVHPTFLSVIRLGLDDSLARHHAAAEGVAKIDKSVEQRTLCCTACAAWGDARSSLTELRGVHPFLLRRVVSRVIPGRC